MVDQQVLLDLVGGLASVGAKVDGLHARLDDVHTRLGRAEANRERGDDDLERRVGNLERWQSKVIGLAAGVGIGSGALSAIITQALTNGG